MKPILTMKPISIISTAVVLALCFVACKKPVNEPPAGNGRTIRYEVTGAFSGVLFASYTSAAGSTVNEQLASLPWNKEITYNATVTAAILALSGNGGTAGQQLTITVRRGNSVVSTTSVVVGANGSFPPRTTPVVTF